MAKATQKHFTIVTKYGEWIATYIVSSCGRTALRVWWDEGCGAPRKVIGARPFTNIGEARAHAHKLLNLRPGRKFVQTRG